MDGGHVSGEVDFLLEAFATDLARKGRGRVSVFVQQVACHGLLGCGFHEDRGGRGGGMGSLDVSGQATFPYEASSTGVTMEGRGEGGGRD